MSSGIWKVTGFLPRVSRVTLWPSCANAAQLHTDAVLDVS